MSTGPEQNAQVRESILRGVAFLRERQLPHGELTVKTWRPAAPEPVRDPSVFGTALIVASLHAVEGTDALRSRACDFLESHRERFGVWRHWTRGHREFHYVPPDLDDTAVTCIALRENGRTVPDNRRLLLANRDGRGLFFSWISLRARWAPSLAYWSISLQHLLQHPISSIAFYYITPSERGDVDAVVNANVLAYLGRGSDTEPIVDLMLNVLAGRREETCDKWYENPFVVWRFFSRALRTAGTNAKTKILERLNSASPGSALDLAMKASVLFDWDERPSVEDMEALLAAQLPSGAWPLAPVYKGRNVRWGSEELTTGFCLEALSRWIREGAA